MAGPNVANLTQHFHDAAQAAAGIAAEMQQLPNWQPAAQQQQYAQILLTLQQMQGQLQQMQGQLAALDHNAHARLMNSRLSSDQQVTWLRNGTGQVPQQAPTLLSGVREAMGANVNALLGHYGLPMQGTVPQRSARLLHHLGIAS